MHHHVKGFLNFIREQGVVGLAIGFILGGAITKVVTSLVNDIINPLIGILLGAAGDLKDHFLQVGGAKIMYGNFLATVIDFLIISTLIYIGLRILQVDRLDRKKEATQIVNDQAAKSASSRSTIRSATSSIPTDKRKKVSSI